VLSAEAEALISKGDLSSIPVYMKVAPAAACAAMPRGIP
jgi:hypothetical protein